MHKLVLLFKGRIQKVFIPESDQCSIGRQADCDIQIDNLAVAPVHVKLHFHEDGVALDITSTESPVLINNKKPDNDTNIKLNRGDEILIGKHVVSYRWENETGQQMPSSTQESTPHNIQNGWLQIISGPKMGRTMHLNKTRLRIGTSANKGAMITSRQDGYYLSALDNSGSVKVNNKGIDDTSINLQDGNTIQVGEMEMLFFIQE